MAAIDVEAFAIPRAGNRDSEWEDAGSYSIETSRFALSDGASAAYRAGWWSHLLVDGYVRDPFPLDDDRALEAWLDERATMWHETATPDEAPYYVREAAARGSAATLLCVALDHERETWESLAIGDTCVFHVRSGELLDAFPLSDPDGFDLHPDLVRTSVDIHRSAELAQRRNGGFTAGDMLLAATDALAQWALNAEAASASPVWQQLCEIDRAGFRALVNEQRDDGALSNDDVTMLRCEIVGAQP